MIWCRFQAGSTVSYGIVDNDVITQVEGDPFAGHKLTSTKHPLNKVKLLIPFVPGGELFEYICQENNVDVRHLVGK